MISDTPRAVNNMIEKRLDAGETAEQLATALREHRPSYGDARA